MAFAPLIICGFDTQGSEEYSLVTGTPTYETTNERTSSNGGLGAAIVIASGQHVELDDPGNTDAYHRIGFAFRAPTSFTDGDYLFKIAPGGVPHFRITVAQSGANYNLRALDANGSTIGTGTTNLSTGTWYHVECIVFLNNTTGTFDLYLDDTSEISGTSLDTVSSEGLIVGVHRFGDSANTTSTYWFEDFHWSPSSTSDTTLLGSGAAVYTYQNSKGASAVPDAGLASVGTSGGDNLNTETWDTVAETPGVDTSPAEYTASGAAGAVDLDGPGSETAIDTDAGILAIKGIWRAERGTGQGSTHYIGLGDDADTNVADTTVSIGTTPSNYYWGKTTGLPTASQNLTQGFGTDGAQDFTCYEMWASVLYVPPASGHTGTGAQSLALFTQSGVGVMQPEGTGAQTLATLSQAGTGAQEFTGTGAQTAAALTQSGVGVEEFTGTGAQTLATLAQAGSGSHVLTHTGTGAQTLAQPSQAGVGVEEFTGTGAQSLTALAQAGSGLMQPEGTGAQTLATPSQAGAGLEEFIGSGAQTLATLAQAGTGEHSLAHTGSATQSLATLSQAAAGLEEFIATGAQAFETLAQSGVGVMQPEGTGAQTLATLAQSGAGLEEFIGTGTQSVATLAQAGTGSHVQTFTATGAQTLATLAQAAAGLEEFIATGAQTAATLTQAGSGVMQPEGTGAQTLEAVTQAGAGYTASFIGPGAQTLALLTQAAAGLEEYIATGAQAFEALAQAGTGTSFVPPVGSGAQTLETLAQSGVAVETIEATGAQTAAALSQSASGVLTVSGAADQLLQSLTQAAVGVESFTSTGASLLAELQQSAASEAPTLGVGAQSLQRLTQYTEEILETRPDWEVGATWVALTSGAGWQDANAAAAAWAAETSSAKWRGDNEASATFGSHSANAEFR